MSRSKSKKSSPDTLLKTSKKGEVELTEDELSRVSGGDTKFKYTTTTKDKVDTYLTI